MGQIRDDARGDRGRIGVDRELFERRAPERQVFWRLPRHMSEFLMEGFATAIAPCRDFHSVLGGNKLIAGQSALLGPYRRLGLFDQLCAPSNFSAATHNILRPPVL